MITTQNDYVDVYKEDNSIFLRLNDTEFELTKDEAINLISGLALICIDNQPKNTSDYDYYN